MYVSNSRRSVSCGDALTASALVYALVLALFIRRPDYQLFIISVVPVLTAAWLFGFTGTVASTLSIVLIHVMMVLSKGQSPSDWALAGGGLGTVTTFLIGTLVSRISSLRTRLDRERSILTRTEDVTIFALAYEAELRDQPTGKHLERVSAYVRILAAQLARSPQYTGYLTEGYISDLARAAPLHDIGKVGVPDAILLKPGNSIESIGS